MSEFDDLTRHIPGIADDVLSGAAVQPLTMDELEFLPDIDMMDKGELEALLGRLEELLDDMEGNEPDEDSEAFAEWEESIDEVADLIDEVQSRIEDIEDEEERAF